MQPQQQAQIISLDQIFIANQSTPPDGSSKIHQFGIFMALVIYIPTCLPFLLSYKHKFGKWHIDKCGKFYMLDEDKLIHNNLS